MRLTINNNTFCGIYAQNNYINGYKYQIDLHYRSRWRIEKEYRKDIKLISKIIKKCV